MEWIKTSDRLPDEDEEVLCWVYFEFFFLLLFNGKEWEEVNRFTLFDKNQITHWMRLPEHPKD
jgi:hypothetical protein